MRRERVDVAGAVVLLVGPRLLVLLDEVRVVLGDRGAGDEPDLAVLAHPLRVDVEVRLGVRHEHAAVHQLRQVLPSLRVDRVGVLVDALGQVDLGARDVQEAVGVSLGERARLLRRDDVVGRGRDAGGERGGRAEGAKRGEDGHGWKF